jgi:hypothetical protein
MPIELARRVASNIDQFTGRAWLLSRVLDWWERSNDRLLLLTGGPGTGKTMFMAWLAGFGPEPGDLTAREQLARLRSVVKAAHFCQARIARSIAPAAFAKSIANQLTASVPRFADALATLADRVSIIGTAQAGTVAAGSSLTGVAISHLDLGALGDEHGFDRAFTQPLKKLYASGDAKPMLLLVDALDEAQTYSGVTLSDLLSRLADLPAGVRILATTRDDPEVRKFFRGTKLFDLIKDADPDVDDVQDYVEGRLGKLSVVGEATRHDFARRLATRAQGNFQYAALVLDEFLSDPPGLLSALGSDLPETLKEYYREVLRSKLHTDDWINLYRPLLGLLAVAQEPLSAEQLTAIVGKDIHFGLRACERYLIGELPGGPFQLFHKSFADFLLDKDSNEFHIDATSMHRRIADYYLGKLT